MVEKEESLNRNHVTAFLLKELLSLVVYESSLSGNQELFYEELVIFCNDLGHQLVNGLAYNFLLIEASHIAGSLIRKRYLHRLLKVKLHH